MTPLLKQADVAKALSCSLDHVQGLVRKGKLKQLDLGRRCVRYKQAWVDDLLKKAEK